MKRSQSAVVLIAACLQLFSPTMARGNDDVPASTEKTKSNDGANSSALVKPEGEQTADPQTPANTKVVTPEQFEAEIQKRVDAEVAKVRTKLEEKAKKDLEAALAAQSPAASEKKADASVDKTAQAFKTIELSGKQFDNAFHNKSVTYNKSTGEVVFGGTTSPACMEKFSFAKGEGATDIVVKFSYRLKSELDCLDKKNVVCDADNECVGLRTKGDARVKLGSESGKVRIVYRDAYNQDVPAEDVLLSKDGEIYHKGTAELAKDKADAEEKAQKERVAKRRKQFREDLRTCKGDDEAQLAIKRDYLEDLVSIGEKTEEEADKINKKLDKKEMELLAKQITSAPLSVEEGSDKMSVEDIKARMGALAANGDKEFERMEASARLSLSQRLAKDTSVHPLVAAENAMDELKELAQLEGLSEKEYQMIALEQMKLGTRIGCLSGTVNMAVAQNAVACQNVSMQIAQERLAAQRAVPPMFDANGKLNPNFMNFAQNASASGTDRTLAGLPAATGQSTPASLSLADFAQLRSPDGGLQFVPNASQAGANGSINGSGYKLLQNADPRANAI